MPIKLNDTYVGDTITQADFDEMKLILNDAHCKLIDTAEEAPNFLAGWICPLLITGKNLKKLRKPPSIFNKIAIYLSSSVLAARISGPGRL